MSGASSVGLSTKQSMTYQDASTILDLSVPSASAPLDISWQSDRPAQNFQKSQTRLQTSTISAGNEVYDRSILETSRISTITEKTYETLIHERKEVEPFKLHALWDSMHPADHVGEPVTSPNNYYPPVMPPTPGPSQSQEARSNNGVLLKEVLNFDDLDMSDISNILAIPSTATKPEKSEPVVKTGPTPLASLKPELTETTAFSSEVNGAARQSEIFQGALLQSHPNGISNQTEVYPTGLPTLSSFLQDIEYL